VAVETWLIDKSAYARLATSPDRELWAERITRGLVSLSGITLLEIGYSFRHSDEARYELSHPPLSALDVEYLSPKIERRAFEIQLELLDNSQHRGVSLPDLLVAATAELTGRTVLHVDSDFDRIASYTSQPVERLAQ
jgi:predicted nucleic acid-binding protein